MVSFKLGLAVLVIALGVAHAQRGHFSTWAFEEEDSEEHGQFRGPRTTNCTCGTTNKANGRIVGGKITKSNEYPHMVGIAEFFPGGMMSLFCGSTILTPHHVITAAHCTADLKPTADLKIIAGGHEMTQANRHTRLYSVVRHIEHEAYNPKTFVNDIAMLIIRDRIQFNEAVGPACLPTRPMNSQLVGNWVKVTGWGDTSFKGQQSRILQKVNLKVVPLDQCAAIYRSISTAVPTQFCTFRPSKDSCQGDSGGPVTWLDPDTNRYTLVGLVSFGRGCATDAPGVNTDVYAFMPWIQGVIANTARYTDSPRGVNTCAKI